MRRIVNILAKMVSAIVLALIFLPLLVALLFEIPAVQNFVAREATEIISRKLGTRISIDRVDIGLFTAFRSTDSMSMISNGIRCFMPAVWMPGSRASACSGEGSFSAGPNCRTPVFACAKLPTGR